MLTLFGTTEGFPPLRKEERKEEIKYALNKRGKERRQSLQFRNRHDEHESITQHASLDTASQYQKDNEFLSHITIVLLP